jgi:tRNA threonylcarbamoyladenosine biosynthesis protein TsaE
VTAAPWRPDAIMERSNRYVWETASAVESERLGAAIGRRIAGGLCISINGPLGAGKTVLVGGFCRGLDVKEDVLSPTYVLYEEFDGRWPVAHVDLYRLEHESEIEELGVFDLLGGSVVILAEWGERSETLSARSDAVIEMIPGERSERRIVVSCTSEAAPIFEGAVP